MVINVDWTNDKLVAQLLMDYIHGCQECPRVTRSELTNGGVIHHECNEFHCVTYHMITALGRAIECPNEETI